MLQDDEKQAVDNPYGLEVVPNQHFPTYIIASPKPSTILEPVTQEPLIHGLSRKTFCSLVALFVIIVALAVGGGVGAAFAIQNTKRYVYMSR
jgi:hypothetical protein